MLNQILFDIGYQNADLLNDPSNLQRTITELGKFKDAHVQVKIRGKK